MSNENNTAAEARLAGAEKECAEHAETIRCLRNHRDMLMDEVEYRDEQIRDLCNRWEGTDGTPDPTDAGQQMGEGAL